MLDASPKAYWLFGELWRFCTFPAWAIQLTPHLQSWQSSFLACQACFPAFRTRWELSLVLHIGGHIWSWCIPRALAFSSTFTTFRSFGVFIRHRLLDNRRLSSSFNIFIFVAQCFLPLFPWLLYVLSFSLIASRTILCFHWLPFSPFSLHMASFRSSCYVSAVDGRSDSSH